MPPQIPRGIEVLVKKAAVDPAFRELLMAKRAAAADEIGLVLEPAEAAMLTAIPGEQLESIIANTHVEPRIRWAFIGTIAAVMLVAVGTVNYVMHENGPRGSAGNRPPVDFNKSATSQPTQPASHPQSQETK
jgi:hypothetical protein